ncbi:hypothetical protein Patl1_07719 [Pistacia atlantica]|uniref:Uncharacterized protein n=1 Tax=Pistacia atlantica TaxID=434234 RepID=A0ACC1ALN5_9ROSI|nr:hypothetical protein Patl1_07719 [Pistacia atlantica]
MEFSKSIEAVIATSFIASTPDNIPTTLKRDGSDFSAAIMGALLRARQVTISTDVDGVYSADPRKVSEAVILRTLSYQEAWEMSYFGANVLHPRTIIPVMRYDIPIVIRNIFNLSAPGTMICRPFVCENEDDQIVDTAVKGTGMAGVPGTANAIWSYCHHDISGKFFLYYYSQVAIIPNCSILAAVGRKMASMPGVSATLFNALAKANINVRAIARGCSEYNITVAVKCEYCVRALRAVHSRGIDLLRWTELLKEKGEVADLNKFTQHVHGNHFLPNTVLVDCTADSHVTSYYHDWLSKGIHVITPNKRANSGPFDQYLKLRALQRKSYTHYFYEATVGAGLPIISTLRGLLETEDKILRIEGIFRPGIFTSSGTRSFSEVVAEAKEAGYTEPDPSVEGQVGQDCYVAAEST